MDMSERAEMIDALKFSFLAMRGIIRKTRFQYEAIECARQALVRVGEAEWLKGM